MSKEFGQLKTNADRVAFVDKIPCVHETLDIEPEFSGKSEGTMCLLAHLEQWNKCIDFICKGRLTCR